MLNKEQKKAVMYGAGPLLIIAGAGTGKTTVITERIAYLVEKGFAKPDEILALTFTEKAATEMEERVDLIMPYGYTQMWIMTFHSFCDRVLRADASHIGYDASYKLLTQGQSLKLLRDNIFNLGLNYFRPLGNPNKFLWGLLTHFSRLQDENVTPNEYLKWTKTQDIRSKIQKTDEEKMEIKKWKELANAYKIYQEIKIKNSYFDFGDLITKTIELFEKRPNILSTYRKKFKYILIDEFQDTNYSQNKLAIALAGKNGNITVVGDDDQAVYRFRGAAVSNILQFRKNFPKTSVVVLYKNYRSGQEILDKAYNLIQFNNPDRLEIIEKIDKKLKSQNKTNGEVLFIHKKNVDEEAEEVCRIILKLIESGKYSYRDFAILVRANSHADPFVNTLERGGIPNQFLGPGKLFLQPEIVDIISVLKFLYDISDSVSLFRILSIKSLTIDATDLAIILSYARKKNLTLFESCERIVDMEISEDSKLKIKNIADLLHKKFSDISSKKAGQILYEFLVESNIFQNVLNDTSDGAELRASNLSKFFEKLKHLESENNDASITTVVDFINLSLEMGDSPRSSEVDFYEEDAVNIMTLHGAKGLEFPVVFLVNLVSQRFPSVERREQIPIPEELIREVLPSGDFHIEEERRLFYVGMTRAKDKLFLTAAEFYGEGKRTKKLSPFVSEALGEVVFSKKLEDKKISFVEYQKPLAISHQPSAISVDYLSYSRIETFKLCPLHYKLKYIYNVPTPASASQSFGVSFHATLKNFYDQIANGTKPSLKLLNNNLEKSWINEGYQNKKHQEESFKKALGFLKTFYNDFYDPKVKCLGTEIPFLIKLDGLSVGGKIDRIDQKGEMIEIVDYKTGANPKNQKEVDRDMQLSIYALAATQIPDAPFGRDAQNIKLSLVYFEEPQIITTTRTGSQIKKVIEEIQAYKRQIEESDFGCSGHPFCGSCEYSTLCKSDFAI